VADDSDDVICGGSSPWHLGTGPSLNVNASGTIGQPAQNLLGLAAVQVCQFVSFFEMLVFARWCQRVHAVCAGDRARQPVTNNDHAP
jgi:hypothetical protein